MPPINIGYTLDFIPGMAYTVRTGTLRPVLVDPGL